MSEEGQQLEARAAVAADVPMLLESMADFNRLEGISFDPAAIEAPLRVLLADPTLGLVRLLHDRGGQLAGYFVLSWGFDLEWGGRDAFLTELYLVPAQRGRGLGAEVMAFVEDAALAGGARALHLAVRHENAAARRVYERAGFEAPKRLLMTKKLPDPERITFLP